MSFADTMWPVFRMEAVTAAVSEFTTGNTTAGMERFWCVVAK
jgi:hypothetical protein